MRMVISLALVGLAVVLVGCGNSAPEWRDPPTKQVAITIAGASYAMELASDMIAEKPESPDEASYKLKGDGYALEVAVRHLAKQDTLDDAVAEPRVLTVTATTRGDALPDGFILSMRESDAFEVEVERSAGDGAIRCRFSYVPLRKADPVTAVVPLLEKMCLSLKAAK